MAHNKVYGVCQNKCSVEVSPKSEKFERVYYTNPGPNCSIEFYRFKNLMLMRIYGKIPYTPLTVEYPEDIPYIMGRWAAREANDNGIIRAESETRQITIQGNINGLFDSELFFLIEGEPIKVVCEVSRTELKAGDNIWVRVNIENGDNHTWQYKYVVKQMSSGASALIGQYTNDTQYIAPISSVGTKDVYVVARDENGNEYESNHVTVVCSE